MAGFNSPAAAIFWLWHAWLDDIYWDWNCNCPNSDFKQVVMGGTLIPTATYQTFSFGGNFQVAVKTLPGNIKRIIAENTLISSTQINSGANVEFRAGRVVRLTDGFRSGSSFRAYIGCGAIGGSPGRYSDTSNQTIETLRIVEDEQENLQLTLDQTGYLFFIYPNPFSKTIIIDYYLSEPSEVSLILYNSFGQQIVKIIDNKHHQRGTYNKSLDISDLPSGLYICTFQAGNYQINKEIIKFE